METKKINEKVLLSTIEKLHENEKLAKDLCCGLPLDIDQAKRIVAALGADPLCLAAVSSWLEAMQESLDETIVSVAYTNEKHAATGHFVKSVIEASNATLQAKKNAILQSLKSGSEPSTLVKELPRAPASHDAAPSHKRSIQGASAKLPDCRASSGYTEWQP